MATGSRSPTTFASSVTASTRAARRSTIREERPGWDLFRDGAPGGEPLAEAAARVDRVIARVLATDGDTIAFAHGHILRILGARWIGRRRSSPRRWGSTPPRCASSATCASDRVIWIWNDTGHVR